MQYLIGTDEAGYGPNLGPLVISATVWRVPDGVRGEDLFGLLDRVVAPAIERTARRAGGNGCPRIAMADSKVLYQPGNGLRHLERGLWAAMGVLKQRPTTWSEVWDALAPDSAAARQAMPWHVDYQSPAPCDADPAEIDALVASLGEGLAQAGVELVAMCSRAIFPREFNELVERFDNKATALSHATLELVARRMQPLDGHSISVLCDKHGGRNRYAPLLAEHFPDRLVEIHGEGRERSVYRFGPPEQRVEFSFQMKGESHLSAALASMASKYLRELAMQAFNAFWRQRVSGLRPTAGYPQDAKRFRAEIAATQADLQIDDCTLWRER